MASEKAAGPRITSTYHCQPRRQRTRRSPRSLTAARPPVRAAAIIAARAGAQTTARHPLPSRTPNARYLYRPGQTECKDEQSHHGMSSDQLNQLSVTSHVLFFHTKFNDMLAREGGG